MGNKLNYQSFAEQFTLSESDIIDHLLDVFHSNLTVKQRLFTKHNLTLILAATFKLSSAMSFSKMTVRDLQKETGISMGSLYKCFSSKAEIEQMVIEGIDFITSFSTIKIEKLNKTDDYNLKQIIKGYIYLGSIFKPWYYFLTMESRTMAPESFKRAQQLQLNFLRTLSKLMNGSLIAASHMNSVIIDLIVRDWKYKNVDIDDFAEHCYKMALLLNKNAKELDDLPLNYST